MKHDAKISAVKTIKAILLGRSLTHSLPKALDQCIAQERPKLQQLVYGTLRDYPRLSAILSHLLLKPIKEKDLDLKALLILGIYQLEYMKTPDYATVSSIVDATDHLGKSWARGLANAVLRRFLREREAILRMLNEAQRQSHSKWMYDKIVNEYPGFLPNIVGVDPLPILKPFEDILRRRYTTTKWIFTFDLRFSEIQRRMLELYLTDGINLDEFIHWQEKNLEAACTNLIQRKQPDFHRLQQAWEQLAPQRVNLPDLPKAQSL